MFFSYVSLKSFLSFVRYIRTDVASKLVKIVYLKFQVKINSSMEKLGVFVEI